MKTVSMELSDSNTFQNKTSVSVFTSNMKLKHEKSLLLPEIKENLSRIECLSWSPNGSKLAACTSANNQIVLFDAKSGEKKEKFALKAVEKAFSRTSFVVKGIAFSPDSSKLAVGQSDCVIFIYKIGDNWLVKLFD